MGVTVDPGPLGYDGLARALWVPGADAQVLEAMLPLDDEEHMPPEDKPQPTVDELEQLRAWIAGGAKFK